MVKVNDVSRGRCDLARIARTSSPETIERDVLITQAVDDSGRELFRFIPRDSFWANPCPPDRWLVEFFPSMVVFRRWQAGFHTCNINY